MREEVLLKSPIHLTNGCIRKSYPEIFAINKCDKLIMSNPKIKRVQEWLEKQPVDESQLCGTSAPTTDCDASGEYTTESDERESDNSEGMADSVATCLQGEGSNSQATSTEIIGGSHEPLTENLKVTVGVTQIEKAKVIMRSNRRNSDRPWSVSCLSQLTQAKNVSRSNDKVDDSQEVGLAIRDYSISESALHILSSSGKSGTIGRSDSGSGQQIRNSESKNSLKKKRSKLRKRAAIGSVNSIRKSESGSDGVTPHSELPRPASKSLAKSESFSGQSNLANELSTALSSLTLPKSSSSGSANAVAGNSTGTANDSEEEVNLMKPNFCLGALTNVIMPGGVNNLGSLAALANYNYEPKKGKLFFI